MIWIYYVYFLQIDEWLLKWGINPRKIIGRRNKLSKQTTIKLFKSKFSIPRNTNNRFKAAKSETIPNVAAAENKRREKR